MADGTRVSQINDGRSLVRLRVALNHAEAATRQIALPAAGTWSGTDPQMAWISPDQWLIVSRKETPDELIERCTAALDGMLHHTVNASDALHCLVVEGAGARTLLAMGSGVDLHPARFTAGQCVRTRLARLAVVIVACQDERFELYVDRSVAAYLTDWLSHAGRDPLVGAFHST